MGVFLHLINSIESLENPENAVAKYYIQRDWKSGIPAAQTMHVAPKLISHLLVSLRNLYRSS